MAWDDKDDGAWDEWSWEAIASGTTSIEFDWFAIDLVGHIAALSSFGVGPAPAIVRESRERFNALLKRIACLPEVTSPRVEAGCSYGDTEPWQEYARRGLFGYDNGDVHAPHHRRYDLIASPLAPIPIADLGLSAALLVCLPRLNLIFGDNPSIDFKCVPP